LAKIQESRIGIRGSVVDYLLLVVRAKWHDNEYGELGGAL
jgi:hypothetical protein